jgi:hypothetical protein
MAEIKKTVQEAGHKIAETATKVGHKISETAEKAVDWVKEKAHAIGHRAEEGAQKAGHAAEQAAPASPTRASIREHMEVMSSCGCRIGTVDRVEGNEIKLTKNDPQAAGKHHLIPLGWVASVDNQVHLNKDAEEARRDWKTEAGVA